jgi:hypothetical protein
MHRCPGIVLAVLLRYERTSQTPGV